MTQVLIDGMSWADLRNIVNEHTQGKIFVVTGKQSYFDCNADSFIVRALSGQDYIRFSDFDSSVEYQPYSRNIPYSVGLLIQGFFHQIKPFFGPSGC